METKHTETVVEKAVAYVKDMFGISPVDKASDGEANRVVRMNPEGAGLTCDDAMGLDPYTFKSVAELHVKKAANDDGTKERLSPAELHDDGPMT
jgi:hypothetical protein